MKDSRLESLLKSDHASNSDDFALSDPDVDIVSDLEALDDPTPEEIEEWARIDKEEDTHSTLKAGDSPVVVSGPPSSTENDLTRAKPVDTPAEQHVMQNADTESSGSAGAPQVVSGKDLVTPVPPEANEISPQLPTGGPARGVRQEVSKPPEQEEDEIMPLLSSGQQQQNASREQGWGWNAAWNLSAIGGRLREVAAEAVKDVTEIKESLSHLLTDDSQHDREDDEREARNQQNSPPAVDPAKRQQVVERLQGPDPQLEVGLQAIDDQVEQLASGAAKALGNIWGGLTVAARSGWNATQNMANKVEAATLELAKELVQTVEDELVKPAHSGIRNATGTVSKMLEEVGRGRSTVAGAVPPGVDPEATFAGCFHLYGGQQSYEELEALSNDCARICNKTRTRLQDDARAEVDDALTKLAPLFELSEGEDKGKAPAPDPTSMASQQLQREYAPVGELQASGVEAAERLRMWATKRLAAILAELQPMTPAPPSEDPQQPPQQQQQQDDSAPPAAAQAAPTPDLGLARVSSVLTSLRAAASQQLAELCSTEIQLLLRLGRSISAPARYGRSSDDGIKWPESPTMKAALLRLHTLRMVQDLKATAVTFTELLTGAGLDAAAALGSESASTSAEVLAGDMEVDCGAAAGRVREGFRNLMYIVLLSALPQHQTAEST